MYIYAYISVCVCIYIKWTNYFFDLPFPNNQNIMFRHRIIINCKTNAWELLFLLLKGSWAQRVDELWAGQRGVYKGSERWGDRRKSRQEGNTVEEHVGYLATSGATEAEDERVQLEKRRKGKRHVLMGPMPWSPFPNVHTCLRMSHSDIKTVQIFRFFQVIIFISMEIKALYLLFVCLHLWAQPWEPAGAEGTEEGPLAETHHPAPPAPVIACPHAFQGCLVAAQLSCL